MKKKIVIQLYAFFFIKKHIKGILIKKKKNKNNMKICLSIKQYKVTLKHNIKKK